MQPEGLQGSRILFIELSEGKNIVHDALVIGINMDQSRLGRNGEPSVECITVNRAALRHAGTADWQHALLRVGDVVHHTHPDWLEGRAGYCYEAPGALPIKQVDIEEIAARAAHEANRVLCAIFGDSSHKPWAESAESIRNSSRYGVRSIEQAPAITPEQQHKIWLEYKVAEGWTYGPERSVENKTHPSLLPHEDLPFRDQVKDYLFGAVVRAVLDITQLSTTPIEETAQLVAATANDDVAASEELAPA